MATPAASAAATTPASATSTAPRAAAAIREEEVTLVTPTGNIHGTLELSAGGFPVPVVLIIAGSASARPASTRDDLGGADKGKHFFIAAFIESFAFGTLQLAGARRSTALAGAVGGTAVIALARETHDRRTKGLFSLGDLVWDSLGAGAALLVLTRTER